MLTRRTLVRDGSICAALAASAGVGVVGLAPAQAQVSGAAPPYAIENARPNKGAYRVDEPVSVSLDVVNRSGAAITLREIHAFVKDISDPYATFRLTVPLASNITIQPGGRYSIRGKALWTVPGYAQRNSFGIYFGSTLGNGTVTSDLFQTFFRVVEPTTLTRYTIASSSYNGLRVHNLDGGMSAEFAVAKSLQNLSPGVGHSWKPSSPGNGPNPVYATPDFVEQSLDHTVERYNTELGATTPFSTVIISTGTASIPYLSRTMKAPVLPTQFLVSSNTVKEIVAILRRAKEQGVDTYSTLGYDGSVAPAVAWIKVLGLPRQYLDFIKKHGVKNVIIAGTTTTGAGEGTAKKIQYNQSPSTGYNPQDIFVLYTYGGTAGDQQNLESRIKDLGEFNGMMEPSFRQISDWESGLVEEQVRNFASAAKTRAGVTDVRLVTATQSGGTRAIYDLATYLSVAFAKKNESALGTPTSVTLNPYLLEHPVEESRKRQIPVLFWQLNAPNDTVSHARTLVGNALARWFPGASVGSLAFHVNTSRNFGGFQTSGLVQSLRNSGVTNVTSNDPSVDELWNKADASEAPCEKIAESILRETTPTQLKSWNDRLQPLTAADLVSIASSLPTIVVTSR